MSKIFLDNMSKEERQAFSYLENLIQKSKLECLAATPKTLEFNDSKIWERLNYFTSKLDKNDNMMLKLKHWMEYEGKVLNRIALTGDILTLTNDLMSFFTQWLIEGKDPRDLIYNEQYNNFASQLNQLIQKKQNKLIDELISSRLDKEDVEASV